MPDGLSPHPSHTAGTLGTIKFMKYYSLKLKLWSQHIVDPLSGGPKVYPRANGDKVSNSGGFLTKSGAPGKIFFDKFVDDQPVFDYFYLYNSTYATEYDWILLDAYAFIGQNVPNCRGFLVSERFKEILESMILSQPFRFYESKLMYQSQKHKYHIFHLAHNEWNNIIFEECKYFNMEANNVEVQLLEKIESREAFKALSKRHKNTLKWHLTLKCYSDIFYFPYIDKGGYVISEKLKNKILRSGLEAFEITEIDKVEFAIKSA